MEVINTFKNHIENPFLLHEKTQVVVKLQQANFNTCTFNHVTCIVNMGKLISKGEKNHCYGAKVYPYSKNLPKDIWFIVIEYLPSIHLNDLLLIYLKYVLDILLKENTFWNIKRLNDGNIKFVQVFPTFIVGKDASNAYCFTLKGFVNMNQSLKASSIHIKVKEWICLFFNGTCQIHTKGSKCVIYGQFDSDVSTYEFYVRKLANKLIN